MQTAVGARSVHPCQMRKSGIPMKQKFNVTGMTCSACSAHVEKAVNKLDDVRKADVSLMTNSMTVDYNESVLTPDGIIHAVVHAGYGATLPQANRDAVQAKAERP